MSTLSYLLSITVAFYLYFYDFADSYHCIVIEDNIPSPFTDDHCIQKIKLLLLKETTFSVEIISNANSLLTQLNTIINEVNIDDKYSGKFVNEGSMYRAFESFKEEGLKQGTTATITTALGFCAWNIVDNFGRHKILNIKEWIQDILSCGQSLNWNEIISQSILWGSASGLVNGVITAYKEVQIIKWSYLPSSTSIKKVTLKQRDSN